MIPIRDVNPTVIRPVLTLAIIAVNIFVFFSIQPHGDLAEEHDFVYEYAAIPCEISTNESLSLREINSVNNDECIDGDQEFFAEKIIVFSVLASMFLHGSLFHLGFNLWSLWIFGNNVEEAFGRAGYLAMYLVGGIVATLGYAYLNNDSTIPLVGASGAIAAVMGAYLVLYPTHRILSLFGFFFIPVPAALFIGIWLVGQFGIDPASNVAWEAHVVGLLFGALLALVFRNRLWDRVKSHQTTRWPHAP